MNFFNLTLFEQGGPIMWLLLLLSLFALILFIERVLFLHTAQIRSTEFVSGIKNSLRKRRLVEALTLCEETPGPVAQVVKAGLLNYEEDEEKMRFAIREAALVEIPTLERRIGSIAAIAQAAPLLGLLGTVLGMISTFDIVHAEGPYVNASLVAGGIWQALLTTAAGLAIAIPAYLGHHFLAGRVRALVNDMEWVGNEMMQFLLKDLPKEFAESDDE
ncbi:MAG TPA: MotA/TolQ/ExbB proton channel family protein [Opitutales bacterium]|nr:MotA/TolQ/ExbB proton channel family protein [Opitutales bacterium]